jgi:hypothetical protein
MGDRTGVGHFQFPPTSGLIRPFLVAVKNIEEIQVLDYRA